MLAKDIQKMNPKFLYQLLKGKNPVQSNIKPASVTTYESAISSLATILNMTWISQHIDSDLVEKMMKEDTGDGFSFAISAIYAFGEHLSVEELNIVVQACVDLYNHLPQKTLGNQSPNQVTQNLSESSWLWGFNVNVKQMDKRDWEELYNQWIDAMKDTEFGIWLEKFEQMFANMLEERVIYSEIYRLYGNQTLLSIMNWDIEWAKLFIDCAIKLNPKYLFALDFKKRIERGDYTKAWFFALMDKAEPFIDKNIFWKKIEDVTPENITSIVEALDSITPFLPKETSAYKYFQFLKQTGIRFETKEAVKTELKTIRKKK